MWTLYQVWFGDEWGSKKVSLYENGADVFVTRENLPKVKSP